MGQGGAKQDRGRVAMADRAWEGSDISGTRAIDILSNFSDPIPWCRSMGFSECKSK